MLGAALCLAVGLRVWAARAVHAQTVAAVHVGRSEGLFGVAGLSAAFGGLLLAAGMAGVRPAYLYRERTGEGLRFLWPAVLLTGGALVALAAATLLAIASLNAPPRRAVVLRVLSGLLVVGVLTCAAVTLWVEGHSGCIGSCG